ncbi:omega-conotoxin-like protein 1 [Anastrepha obliqua]|uniref:omega-conotoxin-like protein 1 n=1 Tax=Anastrepha ludens TaxID=28586 RepID=UPI0023B067E6|nr:omega-conotoxin-like protein 1 [Anastrepha ludens]XP_054742945.1 omega-conotoxin-like protein 1 [Anastrepha obliqua]
MHFVDYKYFILVFLFCLSIISSVNAEEKTSGVCGRHGDPCAVNSDCCQSNSCHRFAKRCQADQSYLKRNDI